MESEMLGVINFKKSAGLFGKISYTKMYCTVPSDNPRRLHLYTNDKRKNPPYRKIVFQALSGVQVPSTVDVKNQDAIDLVLET